VIICASSSTPWDTPRPIVIINYHADKSIARAPARDTSNGGSIRAGKNERQCERRCKLAGNRRAEKKKKKKKIIARR